MGKATNKKQGCLQCSTEKTRRNKTKQLQIPPPQRWRWGEAVYRAHRNPLLRGQATSLSAALPSREVVQLSQAAPCLAMMPDAFWQPAAVTDQLQHTSFWPWMALWNLSCPPSWKRFLLRSPFLRSYSTSDGSSASRDEKHLEGSSI